MADVVVRKDRQMIADALAEALHAEAWERRELRKLRRETLLRLAVATIPGFTETATVRV